MSNEQGWMVTVGLISGYIILAIFGLLAMVMMYVHGFHWRSIIGLGLSASGIYEIMCELRKP